MRLPHKLIQLRDQPLAQSYLYWIRFSGKPGSSLFIRLTDLNSWFNRIFIELTDLYSAVGRHFGHDTATVKHQKKLHCVDTKYEACKSETLPFTLFLSFLKLIRAFNNGFN